ncbi:TfoX/Sxy family protein [Streptomyces flavidovirens]|uniref:TfoX/Sxy family protein n=1 Tax=Streptomyces flavidovirens TaxID=67298 RepID=UPI0003FC78D2|nr:TfoX/Sxy family protein [Streptomyces flavidovirens]
MAFDEGLVERVRARLGADPGITEKRMFSGLTFLHEGNMAVGVIGDELMVRVGPDATEAALAKPGTRPFTGRPMRGWVVVASSAVSEDQALADWIDQGHAFAASLPHR